MRAQLAHDAAPNVADDDVSDMYAVVVVIGAASVWLAVSVAAVVPSVEVEACNAVAARLMPSSVVTPPAVTASSRYSIGTNEPKRRQTQTQTGTGNENKHTTAAAPMDVIANEISAEDGDRTKLT